MTLEIWLVLSLVCSVSLNILFMWFSREQSQRLSYVSQNLDDLIEMIVNYREHLRKVYSLEMFYQDDTLKFLLQHTNALVKLLEEEYSNITYLTDPLEVLIEENEDEEDEKNEETKPQQDVFYGGTRTGDS
tara:strand:- start:379 stop:771 length:393 start_codon:yes stop_codon:yes gene_type:complete